MGLKVEFGRCWQNIKLVKISDFSKRKKQKRLNFDLVDNVWLDRLFVKYIWLFLIFLTNRT